MNVLVRFFKIKVPHPETSEEATLSVTMIGEDAIDV
jgi:hypothetical protein